MGAAAALLFGARRVSLPATDSVEHIVSGSATATTGWQLTAVGAIQKKTGAGAYSTTRAWLAPVYGVGEFEVRATIVSGSVSSGTTGSWLALSSTRTWERTATGGAGASTVVLTIEIRRASTGTVVATCTLTLTATSEV